MANEQKQKIVEIYNKFNVVFQKFFSEYKL